MMRDYLWLATAGLVFWACGTGGGSFSVSSDVPDNEDTSSNMADTAISADIVDGDIEDGDIEEVLDAADTEDLDTSLSPDGDATDVPDVGEDTGTGTDTFEEEDTGPDASEDADTGPVAAVVPVTVYPVSGGGVVRSSSYIGRIAVGGPHPRGRATGAGGSVRLGMPRLP